MQGYGGGNEYDDEDDEEDFRGGADMMNDMDLLTWDVIVKCTPRLP